MKVEMRLPREQRRLMVGRGEKRSRREQGQGSLYAI